MPEPQQAQEPEVDLPALNVRVERVKLADLKLLKLNARYLRQTQFARLVKNIRRDGTLTSVPFAWRQKDGKYLVLSGNHRVQAAIEAEIEEAFVMLCDDEMPKDRRTALQLAHNAIAGEDDPATLKDLYESLEDVDWRVYSGLDDRELELLDKVEVGSLSEANLDFQTTVITFLPTEHERAEAAWKAARDSIKNADEVWLASREDATRTLDALDAAGRAFGVKNLATSLGLVLDVFEAHIADLQDGFLDKEGQARDDKRWVPIPALLGFEMPAGAASVVNQALTRVMDSGEASTPWQALEMMAADYIAGPHG